MLTRVEERHPSPVPFVILATLVGLLLGSWWIGLLIGIGMTIIPGIALIALFIQNLMLVVLERVIMVVGFPFYLAYTGIRRAVSGPRSNDTNERTKDVL
jgi:predicted lipid-binding transport protein (Tim44 family)